MAASAFSNSLLLSASPSSHSSLSHRPCSILPPQQSQISLGGFRSHPRATQLKKKENPCLFTTHCSLDAAKDPKEDTPIESSMNFASQIATLSLSLSLRWCLTTIFGIYCSWLHRSAFVFFLIFLQPITEIPLLSSSSFHNAPKTLHH
jgi:hypothetical protein